MMSTSLIERETEICLQRGEGNKLLKRNKEYNNNRPMQKHKTAERSLVGKLNGYIAFSQEFEKVVHSKLGHKLQTFGAIGLRDGLQWFYMADHSVCI